MTPSSWPLPFYTGRWCCKRYKNPITGSRTKHTYDAAFFGHPNFTLATSWLEANNYKYIVVKENEHPRRGNYYKISFWQDIKELI